MPIQFFEADAQGAVVPSSYRTLRFPGGEQHAVEPDLVVGTQIAWVQAGGSEELFALAMWADSVRRAGATAVALMPYLPGARQDRGRPLGAKVYADFVNQMRLDQVVCFDPHSDVMPALLDNCRVVPLASLPQWADGTWSDVVGVVAPDAGARKRAETVAAVMGMPVFQANKHRDFQTGKLSGFSCEPLPGEGRLLVVDDICDGGRTFIGLADAAGLPPERLALWVSHAVFSQGSELLADRFGTVATTDSHPGHENGRLTGVQITPLFDHLIKEALQ